MDGETGAIETWVLIQVSDTFGGNWVGTGLEKYIYGKTDVGEATGGKWEDGGGTRAREGRGKEWWETGVGR
jgi:hypothetical protein